MKTFNKNKFGINPKSFSLTKINPYYEDKTHYLPYRYSDPSFKDKYNGPLMQKDLYLLNLMNNHFNSSSDKYNFKSRPNLPLLQSNPLEISSKKDIVFNSTEYYKNQREDKSTNYSFSKLKRKFFYINPVLLKKQLINYRNCKFKGIPLYQDKMKSSPKQFMINFQKKVNENNFLNWEKIAKKYKENEIKRGNIDDKFHDNDKIYEVLGLKNPNPKRSHTESNRLFFRHKTIKMTLTKNKLKLIQEGNYKPIKRRSTMTGILIK